MKECKNCKQTKKDSEFNIKKSNRDRLHSLCKTCQRAKYREYWKNADPEIKKPIYAKNKLRNKQKWKEAKIALNALKNFLGCVACGENDCCCIEFHHLNPTEKKDNIGDMVRYRCSFNTLLTEIKKCISLCSNCHRKFHADCLEITQEMINKKQQLLEEWKRQESNLLKTD